jgi:hypothetical protein
VFFAKFFGIFFGFQKNDARCISAVNPSSSGGVGNSLRCVRGEPPNWLTTETGKNKLKKLMYINEVKCEDYWSEKMPIFSL